MQSPITTDVFKYLLVRPVQRVSERASARTTIRDARAKTEDGGRRIAILARELSQGSALERWHSLDTSFAELLAEGCRELVREYERSRAGTPPPDPSVILDEVGIPRDLDPGDQALTEDIWDALYIAHATGPDAGARLDAPMAALRLLHLATTAGLDPLPDPVAGLAALRAAVVIPEQFLDAFSPRPQSTRVAPTTSSASADAHTDDADRIRTLMRTLDATERLLALASSAPVVGRATLERLREQPLPEQCPTQVSQQPDVPEQDGPEQDAPALDAPAHDDEAGSRNSSLQFVLSTTPMLADALPPERSQEQDRILDELQISSSTSLPVAIQALRAHVQLLSDQASDLAVDPRFSSARQELLDADGSSTLLLPDLSSMALSAGDVDVSGRIVPLGIGDLKVVKQTLLSYLPGEVAHIENVLQGESKERTHRKLDRSEATIYTMDEETVDTERDTQSTDRFDLKREAERTVKEDMSVKAGLNVSASYGTVVATATGDFAYSTSKQDTQKSSSNFAREVVDRSVTKVQTRTRTERTTKTLNEVEELNRHSLDNGQPSTGHVTGVYRWVDKHYRAQVHNYGERLLLEFVVPEPAAYYRATHTAQGLEVDGEPPAPFVKDPNIMLAPGYVGLGKQGAPKPLAAEDITEANYLRYAAKYGATVAAPPALFTYVGAAIAPKDGLGEGKAFSFAAKDLVVDAGYTLSSYSIAVSILWVNYPKFNCQVRGDVWRLLDSPSSVPMFESQLGDIAGNNAQVSGVVPFSVACYDVVAFALDIQAVCVRTPESFADWRIDTHTKIHTAYLALQEAYDQKVTEAEAAHGVPIEGQNPGLNRVVEKNELKKACITMMTGQHFSQFGAVTEAKHPEIDVLKALDEGPIVQFFEQAFEWEQLTYLFYPYFWGRKQQWSAVTNLTDPDSLFQQFLSAGAARVLVPVPIAYVDAVLYLLQNPLKETQLSKKVWGGGPRPTIGTSLYMSIAEELRDQTDDLAGAVPEGEPWEFTLPTTLVWLQPDGTLPAFP